MYFSAFVHLMSCRQRHMGVMLANITKELCGWGRHFTLDRYKHCSLPPQPCTPCTEDKEHILLIEHRDQLKNQCCISTDMNLFWIFS